MAVRTQHKLAQHYIQDLPLSQQICLTPSDIVLKLTTPEGIASLRAYWTDSYLNEPYERYLQNPGAYLFGRGFDQKHDYSEWVKQIIQITFELNNRWRPATKQTPVVNRAAYLMELQAYKTRNQRVTRMRQRYNTFRPCQREVIDILLEKHDMDILGIKDKEIRDAYSYEMNRFRTSEEMKANAAKRVKS